MKPILFLFTGVFFATLAGAEISIVRDTPEYYNFTVESSGASDADSEKLSA